MFLISIFFVLNVGDVFWYVFFSGELKDCCSVVESYDFNCCFGFDFVYCFGDSIFFIEEGLWNGILVLFGWFF